MSIISEIRKRKIRRQNLNNLLALTLNINNKDEARYLQRTGEIARQAASDYEAILNNPQAQWQGVFTNRDDYMDFINEAIIEPLSKLFTRDESRLQFHQLLDTFSEDDFRLYLMFTDALAHDELIPYHLADGDDNDNNM